MTIRATLKGFDNLDYCLDCVPIMQALEMLREEVPAFLCTKISYLQFQTTKFYIKQKITKHYNQSKVGVGNLNYC